MCSQLFPERSKILLVIIIRDESSFKEGVLFDKSGMSLRHVDLTSLDSLQKVHYLRIGKLGHAILHSIGFVGWLGWVWNIRH